MTKKTYTVYATSMTTYRTTIEAEDEDEAWRIAKETCGSEFEECGTGDWQVDEVLEES